MTGPVHGPHAPGVGYTLLGGRVAMMAAGRDRPAIDAVLLAAAAPAQEGQRVLDVGCGSGAVGLCLAARVTSCSVTAVDAEPAAMVETATNVRSNGWSERFDVRHTGLAELKDRSGFDLVLSNPPYHEAASSRPPDPARDHARFGQMSLTDWIRHCVRLCRPRGRLVMVLRADRIDEAIVALNGRTGDLRILPIQPRRGQPATRILLHARKGVRTPARLFGGIVLHDDDGSWTAPARALLEQGAAISWDRGDIA